jgi:phenylacetate-CoA ligase
MIPRRPRTPAEPVLRTLRLLRSAPRSGRAALEAHQSARLRRLVAHAYARVPFYRRLFDEHGLEPRHVRGIQDLHLIPITSRDVVQAADPEEVVAWGIDRSRLIVSTTSGSTGRPLRIRRTWLEQNQLYLYRMRAYARLGVRGRDRVMRITTVRPKHPNDSKLLGRVLTALGLHRRLERVSVLLPAEAIAEEYRRFRPSVVIASPSILLMLARALDAGDPARFRPRLVISGSEVLTPDHRARIEQELGTPVRNVYGSYEMGLMAWECARSGAMHTSDDSLILEVLADGRPTQAGEPGDVVVTNLLSFASPFIRFHHADVATRGATPCTCGESFATIGEIQGRRLDFLPLPDGRVLHPYQVISPIVSGNEWVRQYQITQERLDVLVVRVVPSGDPPPERIADVSRALKETLGPEVEVHVLVVPEIPLEPGGKLRLVRPLRAAEPGPAWHAASATVPAANRGPTAPEA